MKKGFSVIIISTLLVSALAYASSIGVLSSGFFAPEIDGKGNIPNPEIGAIVLDSSDSTFYGNINGNTTTGWIALGGQAVPAGTVMPYAGSTAPTGYLLCDGSAVSRSTYSALFAVVGTAFGYGNNSTTFNLPDLRGRFIRGEDGGTGRDPGTRQASATGGSSSGVGSYEPDAFQGHYHDFYHNNITGLTGSGPFTLSGGGASNGVAFTGSVANPSDDGTNGTPRTSSETRPKNIALNYIIKY